MDRARLVMLSPLPGTFDTAILGGGVEGRRKNIFTCGPGDQWRRGHHEFFIIRRRQAQR
jgi:hypothetical protein